MRPLEFRIGLGADIRVTKFFSLSPMVTLGAGAFGTAEYVAPDGTGEHRELHLGESCAIRDHDDLRSISRAIESELQSRPIAARDEREPVTFPGDRPRPRPPGRPSPVRRA